MGLLGAAPRGADRRPRAALDGAAAAAAAAGEPLLAATAAAGGLAAATDGRVDARVDPEFESVSDPGAAGDRSASPPPLPPPAKPAVAPSGGGCGVGGSGGGDGPSAATERSAVARFHRALDDMPVPVARPASGVTGRPPDFLRSRLLPRLDAIEDEEEEATESGAAAAATATAAAAAAAAADADSDAEEEGAFYGVDLGAVASRLWEFHAALPRVRPYFAVKCNPDPVVVKLLAALGASFDCASKPEIKMVAAALGGDADDVRRRVVYANPCKAASHLAFARSVGVSLTTFDNADELHKMAAVAPDAQLLLRIATEDAHALCPLSSKFGATAADVPGLLRLGARLGLAIVGVAFHVGSGCTSLASYSTALDASRAVFDLATRLGLPPMRVVDIGGGFPGFDGDSSITFADIVGVVRPRIDELFDASVDVMAEPGRYLVTSAYSLATQVLSRRFARGSDEADGGGGARPLGVDAAALPADATVRYHLGDGVYGSFKDAVILGVSFPPRLLTAATDRLGGGGGSPAAVGSPPRQGGLLQGGAAAAGGGGRGRVLPSTLCGPTNDALDVILRGVPLPLLSVGEWLYFDNMGAYTTSLCTGFDDTDKPSMYYYSSV